MRPGLLVYALDRSPSGIGQYTRRLLRGFAQLDCSPLVLRAGGGWQGTDVRPLPGCGRLPVLLSLGQLQIAQAARERQLDLVHDPTGVAPLALCPAKRVATIHDVFPLSIPGYSAALESLIYRVWLPWIVTRLDAVITDSRCSQRDICKHLKMPEEKVIPIPHAAGSHFHPVEESEISPVLRRYNLVQPYILYVGSVEPRKNLLRLLEAYALLRGSSPHYRLVIVGARNYWKSSPVAQAVEDKGLQDSVTFTGYVADEDLPALYSGADLFCFPSLYEGFGLPVLEAMACGTPVITSNTSSLPEVAGEAALLVDPYNLQDITAAMRQVLEEPGLAEDLRQRGLQRAAGFTWEETARRTIAVYEQVLAGGLK